MRSGGACGRPKRATRSLGQADHVDPVEVVRRYGGTATYAQLVARTSRGRLRAAVGAGGLRRMRRGVYALPDLPSSRKVVAMTRGVLSHTSAARVHGLEVPMADDAVHITVAPGTRALRPDAVVTHWSPLAEHDAGAFATTPVRTVLDCAMTLPFPQALAVPQHPVDLPKFTAHVDLADVRRRIAIEADSFTYHSDRTAFGRDCERYDELVALDWRVLRITWEHIAFEPEWVVRVVRTTRALRTHAA